MICAAHRRPHTHRSASTVVELLVTLAILAVLIALLMPSVGTSRSKARAVKCLSQLHTQAQAHAMYAVDHRDALVAGRLPRTDACNWAMETSAGRKYRPTFLALMQGQMGAAPFIDPQACATGTDRFGEAGDRQNYANAIYVCPEVADWTDERNGSYGYNYQFLGNARLRDPAAARPFKNWPVRVTDARSPERTVAIGDAMGTAAAFATAQRLPYDNNTRDPQTLGNEGFNLDPPRVDPVDGEVAGAGDHGPLRSAADPRHEGQTNILWLDGHGAAAGLSDLGYRLSMNGTVLLDGDNSCWTLDQRDAAWLANP